MTGAVGRMRSISIFGATGSIGQNTVDLVARDPARHRVVALTGGANIARLAEDAIRLGAELAVTAQDDKLDDLRRALSGSGVEAAAGANALIEAADRPADWVMSAIVGAAGLAPGFRALRHGGTLALANKESLVTAGPLLLAEARAHGATILPVDSEHSAVFQALVGEDMDAVERIIITASGLAARRLGQGHGGRRGRAPQLGDGSAHHHRQRLDVQQGHGADRDARILRCGSGPH